MSYLINFFFFIYSKHYDQIFLPLHQSKLKINKYIVIKIILFEFIRYNCFYLRTYKN